MSDLFFGTYGTDDSISVNADTSVQSVTHENRRLPAADTIGTYKERATPGELLITEEIR